MTANAFTALPLASLVAGSSTRTRLPIGTPARPSRAPVWPPGPGPTWSWSVGAPGCAGPVWLAGWPSQVLACFLPV